MKSVGIKTSNLNKKNMMVMSSIVQAYKQFALRTRQKEAMTKDLEELHSFDDSKYVLKIVKCKNKSEAIRYLQQSHIWVSRVIKQTKGCFWFAEIKPNV